MTSDTEKIRDLDRFDEDVSVGVSSNLHERSFDELITEYAPIPVENRAAIYWYAFNSTHNTALLRFLSRGLKVSFNAITQTAVGHGLAIFKHRYAHLITLLESLEDSAITTSNDRYFEYSDYQIKKPRDGKRLQTRTECASSESIGQLAATLCCDKAYITAICIMLSISTSITLPRSSRQMVDSAITTFDMHMKLKENYILSLIEKI